MHELATHTHICTHNFSFSIGLGGSDLPNALRYNLHGSAHAESHEQASIGGCHANGYDLCANG